MFRQHCSSLIDFSGWSFKPSKFFCQPFDQLVFLFNQGLEFCLFLLSCRVDHAAFMINQAQFGCLNLVIYLFFSDLFVDRFIDDFVVTLRGFVSYLLLLNQFSTQLLLHRWISGVINTVYKFVYGAVCRIHFPERILRIIAKVVPPVDPGNVLPSSFTFSRKISFAVIRFKFAFTR